MQVFTRKPALDLYHGIRVDRDTVLEYKNDTVSQTVRNLEFHSVVTVKGDGFESTYDTHIHLNEGDVLIFEEAGRGYIKPVEEMVTIPEAISDYENIRGLEDEVKTCSR